MVQTDKVSKHLLRMGLDAPHPPDVSSERDSKFIETLKKRMKIKIHELNQEEIIFDISGIDASIANALRRILLAEIATMAIEHVYIWNNSSIIQDEVLSHRLGLIPLRVDPREFQSFPETEEGEATDENTIVFKLDVTCKMDPEHPKDISKAIHSSVYSSDLEWVPQGNQEERFGSIRPVVEDILIAKLRPGQSIALEAHCRKGIGKDHAKFSPVSTASYRLLPQIQFNEPITGVHATQLVQKCPMNVFDIEDLDGQVSAFVKDVRKCTMCRECIREPGWEDKIQLSRQMDHFIFQIESVGMYKPEELIPEAINVLIHKCNIALDSFTLVEEEEEDGENEEDEEMEE